MCYHDERMGVWSVTSFHPPKEKDPHINMPKPDERDGKFYLMWGDLMLLLGASSEEARLNIAKIVTASHVLPEAPCPSPASE